ncbi:NADH-quinone oxidoreductase subunit L [Candidatus Poribacteria bacterium]|nr:NADH-quinone oxidoreductase subunit L [Candidatus Poribacteria bacterium]
MSSNLIALQNRFLGTGDTVYDILSRLHSQQGYISDADILRIAREHHLPPQHVRSTAKFYEELAHDRPARHVVKVCNGEACGAAGGSTLKAELECDLAGSADVRVEEVSCLGYCGKGPNAMVDGTPLSLRDPETRAIVVRSLTEDTAHGLEEPTNAFYTPVEGKPRIVMRHFDGDVVSLEHARRAGIYDALEKAVAAMTPAELRAEVTASQLRGRGGAGFPTGTKFQTVAESPVSDGSGRRFVVVNFDEGDAGAYIDKEIVERDPHSLIEGTLLAAYACGAQEAVIYARFEYPQAIGVLRRAVEEAQAAEFIGSPVSGSSFRCDVRVVEGKGAYICGEETSLLRSLEGLPALVSTRPPFPAQKGLWGCPTAVNNVETLHNLPWIVAHGGVAYSALGHERSRGTKAVSLNTRVRRPGMYEVEFGVTLRELLFDLAGGMEEGQRFKAVQIGGPLGAILSERALDTPIDFESLAKVGGLLGHGGIVVYSHEDDLVHVARGLMKFCAVESCGKCFPCRIGSVRGVELIDQMIETGVTESRLALLGDLCETMKFGSLCGLGGMLPAPIESILRDFPQEFARYR